VKSAHPVEDLDGAGNGHQEGQKREGDDSHLTHAAREHMVCPHEGAHSGYAHAGHHNRFVAEDSSVSERRNDFRDGAHRRKDHDVNGRMGIDPEEVLVQNWIATEGRIEDAEVKDPLENDEQKCDAQDRRGENLDPRRCIKRPWEQRHPHPIHPLRAHAMHGRNEIEAGQNGREAEDEGA